MDGVLIVNKPLLKTSFDVVRDVRKEYNTKKVGHIGTLDPMASGVLPILIGQATKLSDYLMNHDKEYIATLQLGVQTDSGDSEGTVIKELSVNSEIYSSKSSSGLYSQIQEVLKSFLGESSQIPPMYSAIKVNGKKLYELAREGKTIERKPRRINIYNIILLNVNKKENQITFKVVCSKGTYIRTLCEDIAKKLGTCGYMLSLERTRVGNFKIEDSGKFLSLENIFLDIPCVDVVDFDKLQNGMNIKLDLNHDVGYSGFVKLYLAKKFVGLGKANNGYYKRFIII